ncbi:MAG: biopolymer transporter ExbD [Gemmatimonadaceae bacterium]|nr:biopolymer transporter ExbD [Gemmatimonadaceae bacterium]
MPNVTPLVDVMLVLLIIFMIVTPALESGVIAELPVAENLLNRPTKESDHTLAIDFSGAFFLDRKPVVATALGPAIRALYPDTRLDRVLFVKAHKELPYAIVRDALDVARENGVKVVGLVSEKPRP